MALLIKTNGEITEIKPSSGECFTLEELQKAVDGYIEIINVPGGKVLVVDEEGKLKRKEVNAVAMAFAHTSGAVHPSDAIVGDVLLCEDREID